MFCTFLIRNDNTEIRDFIRNSDIGRAFAGTCCSSDYLEYRGALCYKLDFEELVHQLVRTASMAQGEGPSLLVG